MQILTLAQADAWEQAVRAIPGWDVYWLPDYARVWEANGDGQAHLALLTDGKESAARVFLKRPVPFQTGRPLWDIATPYGYGGLLLSPGASYDLTHQFHRALVAYCRETDVVAAFTRCHPLRANHRLEEGTVTWKGVTVYLDLQACPPRDRLKPEVRNRIRRAEKAGLTIRLTTAPPDLSRFTDLYYTTMDRRNAARYYHFSEASFAALRDGLGDHLLLAEALAGDAVVAAALFLYNSEFLHYHLGGSDPAWLPLAPNNKLFHDVAAWGREKGIHQMHLGGGMRPGDSLLRFKGGFSPLRADFHVATQVYNPAAYADLAARHSARLVGRPLQPGYFPEYRAPAAREMPESVAGGEAL